MRQIDQTEDLQLSESATVITGRKPLWNISNPLRIHTVKRGVYEGFNPIVAVFAKLLVVCMVIFLIMLPEASARILDALKSVTLTMFADWYVYSMALILLSCIVIACLPVSKRLRLGPDGVLPEHSTQSWLTMMFCAGIGIGTLAFAVSEPVSHFQTNPDLLAGTMEPGGAGAVSSAMRFVYLHYGFSAWATYTIVGLALGLACHRYGQPMTMRSGLAVILGKRLEGPVGHIIDVISILAVIAGITTTIVLGLEQICSGLSILTGSRFFADNAGNPPLIALFTALVVSTAVAIASIVSGVERGVKWVSQLGLILFFVVLAMFVFFGGEMRVLGVLADGTIAYLKSFASQAITVYDPKISAASSAQRNWQSDWTIFYWAWWIAFAPFVGMFVARISRGRTLREFILGAMVAPAFLCFIWFAGTGGTALTLELDGTAGGAILSAEHAYRIYETVDIMLSPSVATVFKAVLVLLFLTLIVASASAAIIAIKSIGAGGNKLGETPFHSIIWAFVIAANAGAIMAVGGVGSIRDVMIVSAVPLSMILALMLVSVFVIIFKASRVRLKLGFPNVLS
ncbi:BCCT family transporter [Aliiroseovarius sp. KMU-50]|uniref:BCCT family transporter n=1 Tax=Aliiroseovarius salicola TaxID=3009082 RepID=A0ABT4W2V9_9RHOB|nr:BCCT family transporter [Aliiroseovarius sp. KMU-50]MDA5094821.1 BCCT family transporter [Aliiroseovarius sp. KMU-50]